MPVRMIFMFSESMLFLQAHLDLLVLAMQTIAAQKIFTRYKF